MKELSAEPAKEPAKEAPKEPVKEAAKEPAAEPVKDATASVDPNVLTLEVTVKWLPKPTDNPDSVATDQASMKPYSEKLLPSDVSFDMVPIPGGTYKMGSPASEKDRNADEGPQVEVKLEPFWMEKCEVTWQEYELWGLGIDKQRRPTDEGGHRMGQDGRRAGQSDQALFRHVVWHGQAGLSGRLHDPVRRQDVLQMALGQDGPLLSTADRGRMGICLPCRDQHRLFVRRRSGEAWRLRLERATTATRSITRSARRNPMPGACTTCTATWPNGVWTSTSPIATRNWPPGRSTIRWSPVTAEYPQAVRGGAWTDEAPLLRSAARRGSNKDWKAQDPQIPQSIWYHTDANFVGLPRDTSVARSHGRRGRALRYYPVRKGRFSGLPKAQAGKNRRTMMSDERNTAFAT